MIDRLCGDFIKQLGGKNISATSLSKRAKTAKMKMWEEIMIQFDMRIKRKLDELTQLTGFQYVPPLASKYNSQEEAEEVLRAFKDDLRNSFLLKEGEIRGDLFTINFHHIKRHTRGECSCSAVFIFNYF